MGQCRTLVHQSDGAFNDAIDLEEISELIPDIGNVLWLDIQDPTSGDIELLRKEFGFHELALEDVMSRHERAKADQYEGYYFVVFYSVRSRKALEINLFIGENYLVTVHHEDVPEITETVERWRKNADRIERGVGVLVYSLLDTIVDAYFPVIDEIAEQVEDIEQDIFGQLRQDCLPKLFALKKELLHLRRTLSPERDVLNVLARRDEPILGKNTAVYFQDVYDHALRVLEAIDLYRDQLSGILDAYLTVSANRLNFVVKRMTAMATILMSVTLIAGIYGMNFENMPELTWEYGYFMTLGFIALLGISLVTIFKRIGWL